MKILTVKEIAERFRMSRRWVYRHATELGGSKIGDSWFFTEESLNAAIDKARTDTIRYKGKKRAAGKDPAIREDAKKFGLI